MSFTFIGLKYKSTQFSESPSWLSELDNQFSNLYDDLFEKMEVPLFVSTLISVFNILISKTLIPSILSKSYIEFIEPSNAI